MSQISLELHHQISQFYIKPSFLMTEIPRMVRHAS